MTPHIDSQKEDIAKIVLMPGDPLRAKHIAETFLENVRMVNSVRNMIAFTGTYHGTEVTVFPSGMGIPSIGIYAYELFHFYDVDMIIRLGSAGSKQKDVAIRDIVLADSSYSLSDFALLFSNEDVHKTYASKELNDQIEKTAIRLGQKIHRGGIITSEIFDPYVADYDTYMKRYPADEAFLAAEMEAFALFHLAKKEGKQAACLVTISDSIYDDKTVSSEDREKALDEMIILALESVSNKS